MDKQQRTERSSLSLSIPGSAFWNAHPYLTGGILCLLMEILGAWIPARVWILAFVPLLAVLWIFMWYKQWASDKIQCFFLYAIGFCMRYAYILATPHNVRFHDLGSFGGDAGHAGYITYFYNNLHLPDFDVRLAAQFYHPPLHHIISAIWMHIQTAFGVSFETAGENVQMLTMLYSFLCMMLLAEILHTLGIFGAARNVAVGLLAFHPTFFLLAGSINNDMLSITFMLASILLTLKWYRNPKLSTILKLALTIGCGMMTKLSAWMVAPAAALAFLLILLRNRKQILTIVKQYVAFGVLCVPLGLWWGIRNLIGWNVPITYVPFLGTNTSQYIGDDYTVMERLFDFSSKQWTYVYDCFTMYGQPYNEYNPLIGLLKTSLFDELINDTNFPDIAGFGESLFLFQALVVLASVVAIIIVCIQKSNRISGTETILLLVTYGITLISYYSFCFAFPHTCTQNMRYATPLIFIGLVFLAVWMDRLQEQKHALSSRICRYAVYTVSAGFIFSSYIVYYCVCI